MIAWMAGHTEFAEVLDSRLQDVCVVWVCLSQEDHLYLFVTA